MNGTILITINSSWNIVNFRRSLIEALKAQGYRVVSAAPNDAYTDQLRQLVDVHYELPMQNHGTSLWQDALLWLRYVRLLHKLRPSAMLAFTIKPNIYGTLAAALLNIPVINNVSGLGTVFIKRNWLTRLAKGLYRFAFRYSSCVFFQNAHDRELFIQNALVPAQRAGLLAGSGIDLQAFQPLPRQHKEAGEACDFVLIARMLLDKGVGEYVQAARLVRQQQPQCRFRLVGPLGVHNKTAIDKAVMDQWQQEGVIDYWGERTDIAQVMAQHDCVVLPSYREGMSRVLLEAAACAMPMITTDVPGCRDVVEHGVNGLLCQPRDAEDLARAMLAFVSLSQQQKVDMSAKSRQVAEQRFDEKEVHQAYLQRLASCI